MAQHIDVVAVYRMPASLALSEGCFSKNFTVNIGGLTGKATTPSLVWKEKDDEPHIVAPLIDEQLKKYVEHYVTNSKDKIEKWNYWGSVNSWNPKTHVALNAHVRALLIHFKIDPSKITYSNYLYGRGHPTGKTIDTLFAEVDEWFERIRVWVEAASDQDINPRAPLRSLEMRGSGLHVFTMEKETVSLPANSSSIVLVKRDAEKVKLPIFRKIINLANAGTLPSDAHMLLCESRAAKRRGQYRRAVIDAGSATEITLADFNNRVTRVGVQPGKLPTLGWYVNQRAIKIGAALPTNTKADLVDIRNSAIHQNQVPTTEETNKALALAEQIVNYIDPLPL